MLQHDSQSGDQYQRPNFHQSFLLRELLSLPIAETIAPLSDHGRRSVRAYLVHALIEELEQKDIQLCKRLLVDHFGCSRQAVDGVQAQLTKELNFAFAAASTLTGGETAALLTAIRRLEDTDDVHYRKLVITDIATKFSIDPNHLETTVLRFQTACGARPASSSLTVQTPYGAETGKNGGAHVDYDNPTKRRWRAAWESEVQKFVASFPPSRVRDLRVLCLPSKNPHAELSIYARAGIPAENVYAIEGGDRSARREFLHNISRLGDQYRRTNAVDDRLESWLPTVQKPFDIVSLDFHGPVGETNFGIISRVPCADRALFMSNHLASRETPTASEGLIRSAARLENPSLAVTDAFRHILPAEMVAEAQNSALRTISLGDARLVHLDTVVTEAIGIGATAHLAGYKPLLDRFAKAVNQLDFPQSAYAEHYDEAPPVLILRCMNAYTSLYAMQILVGLQHTYGPALNAGLGLIERQLISADLVNNAVFERPYARWIRKLEYRSQTNDSALPYYTTIAELATPRGFYRGAEHTVTFLLTMMTEALEARCQHMDDPRFPPPIELVTKVYNVRNKMVIPGIAAFPPHRKDRMHVTLAAPPRTGYSISVEGFLGTLQRAWDTKEKWLGVEGFREYPETGRLRIP